MRYFVVLIYKEYIITKDIILKKNYYYWYQESKSKGKTPENEKEIHSKYYNFLKGGASSQDNSDNPI